MTKGIPIGISHGIPFSAYSECNISKYDKWEDVAGKSVSKSLITKFIEDPWAWRNAPRTEPTRSMQAGSLLDTLLTEPDKFHTRYVMSEYDEFRTKESKAWRDEMEAAGMIVLKQDQFDYAQAQLNAIKAKPEAASLIKGAQFQVAFKHKTKHPFNAKGLIDIVPTDKETLVDLKTCEPSALESKRSLARHIHDWLYHAQAGAYCQGWSIASGQDRTRFKFIFVSNKPPFRVAVVELPFSAIMFGTSIYMNGIDQFAKCLENNYFPSIWDGEVELDLPQYAYTDNE